MQKGKRAARAADSFRARRDEKKPWFCLINSKIAGLTVGIVGDIHAIKKPPARVGIAGGYVTLRRTR
ncbi:MAG: hypothetical protein ACM3JF_03420 [Sphaerimonospora mesophila]